MKEELRKIVDIQNEIEELEKVIKEEKEIVLNGQKLTESQFNEKKKEIETQKGMLLIEVSPGVYKTRLND